MSSHDVREIIKDAESLIKKWDNRFDRFGYGTRDGIAVHIVGYFDGDRELPIMLVTHAEEYQSLKLVMRLIAEIRWFEELNPRRRRNEL